MDLAGGQLLTDSFGELRAPNITPDKETGIGDWNVAEIMRALRASINRAGEPLSLDTHGSYRWMSDRDAKAIAIALLAREPRKNPVERRVLGGFERNRFGLFPQHQDFAGYVPALSEPKPQPGVPEEQTYDARWGRYLSNHVAQCYTCHTAEPNSPLAGVPFAGGGGRAPLSVLSLRTVTSLFQSRGESEKPASLELVSPEGRELVAGETDLSGETSAEDDLERPASLDRRSAVAEVIAAGNFPVAGPDIRGGSGGALASWTIDDVVRYLSSGVTRGDGQGEERVVDTELCPWESYSRMSPVDKRSIAAYLKTL
jgi:mono/diheme cytochrome c family protein